MDISFVSQHRPSSGKFFLTNWTLSIFLFTMNLFSVPIQQLNGSEAMVWTTQTGELVFVIMFTGNVVLQMGLISKTFITNLTLKRFDFIMDSLLVSFQITFILKRFFTDWTLLGCLPIVNCSNVVSQPMAEAKTFSTEFTYKRLDLVVHIINVDF